MYRNGKKRKEIVLQHTTGVHIFFEKTLFSLFQRNDLFYWFRVDLLLKGIRLIPYNKVERERERENEKEREKKCSVSFYST